MNINFPKINSEENIKLFNQYIESKDRETRNIIVKNNLKLVSAIAYKYKKFDEDIFQVGCIGLIRAVETFNPDKGIKFETYASRCIRNEIFQLMRSEKRYTDRIQSYLDEDIQNDKVENVTMHEMLKSDLDIENDFIEREVIGIVTDIEKKVLSSSNQMTQKIINLRKKKLTQKEVAQQLGVGQGYVSRLEKKFYKKLRQKLSHVLD